MKDDIMLTYAYNIENYHGWVGTTNATGASISQALAGQNLTQTPFYLVNSFTDLFSITGFIVSLPAGTKTQAVINRTNTSNPFIAYFANIIDNFTYNSTTKINGTDVPIKVLYKEIFEEIKVSLNQLSSSMPNILETILYDTYTCGSTNSIFSSSQSEKIYLMNMSYKYLPIINWLGSIVKFVNRTNLYTYNANTFQLFDSLHQSGLKYANLFDKLRIICSNVSLKLSKELSKNDKEPLYYGQYSPGGFENNKFIIDGVYNDMSGFYPLYEMTPYIVRDLLHSSNVQLYTTNGIDAGGNVVYNIYNVTDANTDILKALNLVNYDTSVSFYPLYATTNYDIINKEAITKLMLFQQSFKDKIEKLMSIIPIDFDEHLYNLLIMIRSTTLGSFYVTYSDNNSLLGGSVSNTEHNNIVGGASDIIDGKISRIINLQEDSSNVQFVNRLYIDEVDTNINDLYTLIFTNKIDNFSINLDNVDFLNDIISELNDTNLESFIDELKELSQKIFSYNSIKSYNDKINNNNIRVFLDNNRLVLSNKKISDQCNGTYITKYIIPNYEYISKLFTSIYDKGSGEVTCNFKEYIDYFIKGYVLII
ncbi:hypothetical protein RCL1_006040 [Eukaryota sp. TZLM3-RCL]